MQEPFDRRAWAYAMLYVNLYGPQLLYSARIFGQVFLTRTVHARPGLCIYKTHQVNVIGQPHLLRDVGPPYGLPQEVVWLPELYGDHDPAVHGFVQVIGPVGRHYDQAIMPAVTYIHTYNAHMYVRTHSAQKWKKKRIKESMADAKTVKKLRANL